jgi:hypothetical protein
VIVIDSEHKFLDYDYELRQGYGLAGEHECEIAQRRRSPTLAGISYRRKALAKISLLAVGFPLLVGFSCLLLGTRTCTTA